MAAAIAALAVLGAVAWFSVQPNAAFEPYVFEEYRGMEAEPANTFEEGMQQYTTAEYTQAIATLEQLPTDHPKYEKALFALANAYAASGSNQKAINAFERLLAQEDWTLYRAASERALETLRD